MHDKLHEFLEIAERAEYRCERQVSHFYGWASENAYDILKLTRTQAREYKSLLEASPFSSPVASLYLRTAHSFYTWLYTAAELSPFRGLRFEKPRRRGPKTVSLNNKIMTPRQVDLFRAAIGKIFVGFEYYRAHVIVAGILYMGLSVTELLELTVTEVRTSPGYLDLPSRKVPVTKNSATLLKNYLSYRATYVDALDQQPAFLVRSSVNRDNEKVTNTLTSISINNVVKKISEQSGVVCTPKILHNTFCYNLAMDGAPLPTICSMANISADKILKVLSQALQEADLSEEYVERIEKYVRPVKRSRSVT